MTDEISYSEVAPRREEIDALPGKVVLNFGTNWCGYCLGAQSSISAAFSTHPDVRHIKVEDGPGRPLGRSYEVKLWPTLVFLRDGKECARVVRPGGVEEIAHAFALIELT